MQYILAVLLIPLAIMLIKSRWIHRKHSKLKDEWGDLPTHTKEQQDFFKGKPSVNFHGRLINMDEHADGIVEEK